MKTTKQQMQELKEVLGDYQMLLTSKSWTAQSLVEARQKLFFSIKEIVGQEKLVEFEKAFEV